MPDSLTNTYVFMTLLTPTDQRTGKSGVIALCEALVDNVGLTEMHFTGEHELPIEYK